MGIGVSVADAAVTGTTVYPFEPPGPNLHARHGLWRGVVLVDEVIDVGGIPSDGGDSLHIDGTVIDLVEVPVRHILHMDRDVDQAYGMVCIMNINKRCGACDSLAGSYR